MFSKTIVQALALAALVGVGAADCSQNGPASSLFQSCGQVQGSMNVCTTGAITSCSCSVLAHQSSCYQSYKDNYCSTWVYQNDYFSANCGDNYADETSSTKSDKPASATADATTTSDSSSATSKSSSSSSSSSASSRSSAAAASASATGSSSASSASASGSATPSSTQGSNAAGAFGANGLLVGAALMAALI